jgi:hypothetical protein
MALGAYGSTMEGPIPQSYPSNLQYILLPEGTTNATVARRAMSLPPFYTKGVQVDPTQVLDTALTEEVARLLPPDIGRYSTTWQVLGSKRRGRELLNHVSVEIPEARKIRDCLHLSSSGNSFEGSR